MYIDEHIWGNLLQRKLFNRLTDVATYWAHHSTTVYSSVSALNLCYSLIHQIKYSCLCLVYNSITQSIACFNTSLLFLVTYLFFAITFTGQLLLFIMTPFAFSQYGRIRLWKYVINIFLSDRLKPISCYSWNCYVDRGRLEGPHWLYRCSFRMAGITLIAWGAIQYNWAIIHGSMFLLAGSFTMVFSAWYNKG